ncbi:hypothetical protein LTR53_006850 [Teratosphaeriaceae sp. CCFEE 6253]|nr:hypothetical protein LTR53_006850 [Teratosphaeriaceae sp. CCFEE 6253]
MARFCPKAPAPAGSLFPAAALQTDRKGRWEDDEKAALRVAVQHIVAARPQVAHARQLWDLVAARHSNRFGVGRSGGAVDAQATLVLGAEVRKAAVKAAVKAVRGAKRQLAGVAAQRAWRERRIDGEHGAVAEPAGTAEDPVVLDDGTPPPRSRKRPRTRGERQGAGARRRGAVGAQLGGARSPRPGGRQSSGGERGPAGTAVGVAVETVETVEAVAGTEPAGTRSPRQEAAGPSPPQHSSSAAAPPERSEPDPTPAISAPSSPVPSPTLRYRRPNYGQDSAATAVPGTAIPVPPALASAPASTPALVRRQESVAANP